MKKGLKKNPEKPKKVIQPAKPSVFYPEIHPSPSMTFTSFDINSQISSFFGYEIYNSQLLSINSHSPYVFSDNYEAIGTYIALFIQCIMKEMGLLECWIPQVNPSVNIFMTQDFYSNTAKVLLIIHGKGQVRAGQWSRKICVNESLDSGSIIPYLNSGISLGYSILVANPNLNRDLNGNPIWGNSDMLEHTRFIWENFIRHCPAEKICIIGHSCGGVCTLHIVQTYFKEVSNRVKAICLLDSVHKNVAELNLDQKKYFAKVAQNWKKSKSRLGSKLPGERTEGCNCVSAGDSRHEYTSSSAFSEVFPYCEGKMRGKKK